MGLCTQLLGTWVLANSNYSIQVLGKYMTIGYLDP